MAKVKKLKAPKVTGTRAFDQTFPPPDVIPEPPGFDNPGPVYKKAPRPGKRRR